MLSTVATRTVPPRQMPVDAPAQPPKISVRNLDFYYGSFQALKSVGLEIAGREVTAASVAARPRPLSGW